MKTKSVLAALMACLVVFAAQSQILITHTGATNPTNEGFSYYSFSGVGTVAPISDMGVPAWNVTCPNNISTQYGYVSGALPTNQLTEVKHQGFTITLVARVFQNYAPAFNVTTPYLMGLATFSPTPTNRYDIDLAVDSSGNTIVLLPSIVVGALGSTCAAPSTNLMVMVPGNGYHTYQLVQSPVTGLADLYVDHVKLVQGYSGTFVPGGNDGYGLLFGACNGAGINFNLAQVSAGSALSPVPLITWTNPAPILYGAALSSIQLNASANVPGSFAYNPTNGTVLNVGTNILSVIFTPTETADSSVTDSVSLVVLPPALLAPTFTLQPVSQIVGADQSVTFMATATGYPPPTYQWQLNGTNIDGATGSSYTIPTTALTDIGYYTVVIANSVSTNTSASVSLTFLNLAMYAGLDIIGPIGANYNIQSIPALNGTNWTTLTNISLPMQPYIYIDYNSPTNSRQFYRAVPQ